MADLVFVTNRTVVQLPGTPDRPEGTVVVLEPGLNEVPDVAASDSFIRNLVTVSAPQVEQAQADRDAARKVLEANAQAAQVVAEAQQASLEAKMSAGEEWAMAREEAMEAGLPFSDPHPDPVTQQSIVLTSPPHVYAASGMVGKAATMSPPSSAYNGGSTGRVLPEGEPPPQ